MQNTNFFLQSNTQKFRHTHHAELLLFSLQNVGEILAFANRLICQEIIIRNANFFANLKKVGRGGLEETFQLTKHDGEGEESLVQVLFCFQECFKFVWLC